MTVLDVSPTVTDDRTRWNEKYADPEFELPTDPIPELTRVIDRLPEGRALDVATGYGRNAIYLAEAGYEVDAIDVADQALQEARRRARKRSVTVNWIQADLMTYPLPMETYDVVTLSFFGGIDLLSRLKDTLTPGGILIAELHLRTTEETNHGPSDPRSRMRANELLHTCLDLTVLRYQEGLRVESETRNAVCTIVARNSHGASQPYPAWETVDH